MNEHIDTREGWQELDVVTPESIYQLAEYDPNDGSVVRAWVRVSPVPPLPTEPYTVIRVTWRSKVKDSAVLLRSGTADKWSGMGYSYDSRHLSDDITGFEVLAEPRAVTAKAVLDRVRERIDASRYPVALADIAREFGVSS